jgi:inosose dehydratase
VHRLALSPACWGISDVEGWGPQLGVERVLTEAEAMGEGAITAGPLTFLPNKSEETRALLKRHKLQVVAGKVQAVLHHLPTGGAELAHVDGHAQWLAVIGAETLVLSAIPHPDIAVDRRFVLSNSEWAQLLHLIGSVEHVCARHHLKLAVQPRFGSSIHDAADIERLLVGTEAGICFDLGQLVLAGADPVDVLSLAVGRINHVHLNDVDPNLARQVRERSVGYNDAVGRHLFRPLGEGGAQVSHVVEALRNAKYSGWYTLEQETRLGSSDERPLGRISRSLEYLLPLLS